MGIGACGSNLDWEGRESFPEAEMWELHGFGEMTSLISLVSLSSWGCLFYRNWSCWFSEPWSVKERSLETGAEQRKLLLLPTRGSVCPSQRPCQCRCGPRSASLPWLLWWPWAPAAVRRWSCSCRTGWSSPRRQCPVSWRPQTACSAGWRSSASECTAEVGSLCPTQSCPSPLASP